MKQPEAICSDSFYFERDKKSDVLIMGLGNYLMGDEGIGVQAIQKLSGVKLPETVDLLDGGTGGFLLLSYFESYGRIILIDATMDGKPPGTINLIQPNFASDYPPSLSVHDVGLKDMIEAVYMMDTIPEIYLFTVSISEIEPMCVELSPEVKKVIPSLIDAVERLCEKLMSSHVT
ncbi:MAG: hydrogenase maturation protease [Flavobacteriaceae bacterium]|nr:hydrogenase maturation protease [Bacteroidia bacterium]NNK88547.1 hydrogenase maturation protease [Flavobacteriaceae bacterium]